MEEPNNFQLATATCNESRHCAYGLHECGGTLYHSICSEETKYFECQMSEILCSNGMRYAGLVAYDER